MSKTPELWDLLTGELIPLRVHVPRGQPALLLGVRYERILCILCYPLLICTRSVPR